MVSASDSPLTTDDVEPPMLKLSAESLFSASSKELLVRVEGSKNKLTMVRPRNAGTFLIERLLTSSNEAAVSKICEISSAVKLLVSIKCLTDNISTHLPHAVNLMSKFLQRLLCRIR